MILFIPARKGSERVKNKNMTKVLGRPLVQWTFDAVQQLNIKWPVLVSTDDDLVWQIATGYGFTCKERPADLCDSKATMSDVLYHHLPDFDGHESVMVLYPTSPLRTAVHLQHAINLWRAKGGPDRTLMSVTPVLNRPYGLMKVRDDGFLKCNLADGERYYQSQNMPVDYRANGAIFILPLELLKSKGLNSQLFCDRTLPFIMDETDGFEIDNTDDLRVAEVLMRDRLTFPMDGSFSGPAREVAAAG